MVTWSLDSTSWVIRGKIFESLSHIFFYRHITDTILSKNTELRDQVLLCCAGVVQLIHMCQGEDFIYDCRAAT